MFRKLLHTGQMDVDGRAFALTARIALIAIVFTIVVGVTAGIIAALRRGEYTMAKSAEFHNRVATCTHNRAIEMLMRTYFELDPR